MAAVVAKLIEHDREAPKRTNLSGSFSISCYLVRIKSPWPSGISVVFMGCYEPSSRMWSDDLYRRRERYKDSCRMGIGMIEVLELKRMFIVKLVPQKRSRSLYLIYRYNSQRQNSGLNCSASFKRSGSWPLSSDRLVIDRRRSGSGKMKRRKSNLLAKRTFECKHDN